MDTLFANLGTVVLWIGVIDAFAILAIGVIAAVSTLFDIALERFWSNLMPTVFILVGTSVAAGIVMLIARWVAGLVA